MIGAPGAVRIISKMASRWRAWAWKGWRSYSQPMKSQMWHAVISFPASASETSMPNHP